MKAIITVGISASGKTTFAKQLESEGWVDINRDTIRFTEVCPNGNWNTYKFTRAREDKVTEIQTDMVHGCASVGKNIIISDTNLNPKTREKWKSLLKDLDYEVEIKDFPITYEEAVKRDKYRLNGVGQDVIYKQYQQWLGYIGRKRYVPDYNKPSVILVDIDGTVADHKGIRSPYEWDKVGLDKPRSEVIRLIEGYYATFMDTGLIFLSGRDGVCYEDTKQWLYKNTSIESSYILLMRKEGDTRKDTEIKEEIFWRDIEPYYNVVMAIDDRPCMVKLWYEIGIPNVISVANPWLEF